MPKTLNVGSPSLFVTLTAWVAIVLAAGVAVVAGLQHAQLVSVLPGWADTPLPLLTGLLLRYLPWALATTAALSLLMLAAAVGLLLRLDWARRVFMALAALAIGGHLVGLWLQHEVVQALLRHTLGGGLPAQAAGTFGGLAAAAQAMGVLVTLGACVVLGWVILRLNSEPVRQEFA